MTLVTNSTSAVSPISLWSEIAVFIAALPPTICFLSIFCLKRIHQFIGILVSNKWSGQFSRHFRPFKELFFISNFLLTPPSTYLLRGAPYTLLFWNKSFSYLIDVGAHIKIGGLVCMCFINNSFMLRFISKLVVGSGLIHFSSPIWKFFDLSPHFISSSLLDSAAAVFIQFVQVGHLLSFFHCCPYFFSYCFRFLIQEHYFSIDQGCTTFDDLTKKVTLFPCLLLSSVGSLGRTHIIGLLKGEWCIGEYYFGFQLGFSF